VLQDAGTLFESFAEVLGLPGDGRLFERPDSPHRDGAGLPRLEAERLAAQLTATLARNRSYSWASLRSALSDYPVLAAQVPATDGAVGRHALGLPTVAVLKGWRVVRQGAFVGSQEVVP
jgi:hypothetical protein